MKTTLVLVLAMLAWGAATQARDTGTLGTSAGDWKMQPVSIPTRWAAFVSPTNALPEYPRPQLVRAQWQNLNGLWDYLIAAKAGDKPSRYAGKILVPYPLESALSGVEKSLGADQLLWYRRTFDPGAGNGRPGREERTLLHFGAVDFQATAYVNGVEVGTHSGGYEQFTFDITSALRSGQNELILRVWDPTDNGPNPHGKQGIQHTATSGIWQTVWLERVPQAHIESLKMTPDVDRSALRLEASLASAERGDTVEATVRSDAAVVAHVKIEGETAIRLEHPHLWSPDDPYLYDLEVRVLRGSKVIDRVTSYFGMRKIEVKPDTAGVPRIFLNGRYTYNLGTLDRGWWPDGIYTAPTDAALKFDIEATKAMGFNTIRKHIKVEPDRWYYYCDKLGLLVWQDMVNPANFNPGALTSEAKLQFEHEVGEVLAQLHDHPSIIMWVLFNEGWGAYDQGRLSQWVKRLDPSRLLDTNTGFFDQVRIAQIGRNQIPVGDWDSWDDSSLEFLQRDAKGPDWAASDLSDLHHYPDPRMPPAEAGKARVLGEYSGVGVPIDGHLWNELQPTYSFLRSTPDQFEAIYADYVDRIKSMQAAGLSGSIYTNPFDVEQGNYGLMTYDRAVIKIPLAEMTRLNNHLVPRAANYVEATRGFSAQDADRTPDAQRYAALLQEYQRGMRNPDLLKRLTLMALRQKDQPRATEAANAYLASAAQPYSKDTWELIAAATQTSRDEGFNILRTQAAAADASLGPSAAENLIRRVIRRELIEPALSDKSKLPSWDAIEKQIDATYGTAAAGGATQGATAYGLLGSEALSGARMVDALVKENWTEFGHYFDRYFATAAARSEYPLGPLAWRICEHVDDPQVMTRAVGLMQKSMDLPAGTAFGRAKDDPTWFDTYACLLSKTDRPREALAAQEEAARLSENRDPQINERLEKLRIAQVSWQDLPLSASACASKAGVRFVCGPRNAEDLVDVPNTPWIIASGLADEDDFGGALYRIGSRDGSWRMIYPSIPPANAGVSAAGPSAGNECTAQQEPSRISAHGLNLRSEAAGRHTLYVVNHALRESVELFELDAAQGQVRWKGCVALPDKAVGNSVVPLPDGGFAVTAAYLAGDTRVEEEMARGEPTGYALEWHAGSGWQRVPGSEGSFPNGIEVSPDGAWLYITNTGSKNIVRLSRGGARAGRGLREGKAVQKRMIATQLLTDNLRWDATGTLWVTGQLSPCRGDSSVCAEPYEILRLNPRTLSVEPFEHAPTAPEFGAGTVAVVKDQSVWVGTYMGDRIARFPLHGAH